VQGTKALLDHRLRTASAWSSWPAKVREALRHDARMQTALDLLRERELITLLAALAASGVETLLLKGAALAYSHYPLPASRSRCDTDVLIRPADCAAARRVLARSGYERRNEVSGTLVSFEECHVKRNRGVDHVIDLHWQINNAQVFANALGYDEAYARSVPIQELGAPARALCPAHALLLACMHRAAHLGADGEEGNRLVWLYDIHLIANAMTVDEWPDFAQMCTAKGMRRITLDAFDSTRRAFATAFPGAVIEALSQLGAAELSATYLDADRKELLLTDLRALPTWHARATLVRESLFPPVSYVLAKYQSERRWLLPWWYARRAPKACGRRSRISPRRKRSY